MTDPNRSLAGYKSVHFQSSPHLRWRRMGNCELKPLSAVPSGLTLPPYRFDRSNLSNRTFLESLRQWSTGAQGSVSICVPGFLWLIILVGHLPSFSMTISEHRDCHTATAVAASVWSSGCSMSALVQPCITLFLMLHRNCPSQHSRKHNKFI